MYYNKEILFNENHWKYFNYFVLLVFKITKIFSGVLSKNVFIYGQLLKNTVLCEFFLLKFRLICGFKVQQLFKCFNVGIFFVQDV